MATTQAGIKNSKEQYKIKILVQLLSHIWTDAFTVPDVLDLLNKLAVSMTLVPQEEEDQHKLVLM